MADERDPKVSQRYRELGSEEPPRELDQSILAAAHRAPGKSHAPLVTPAGRHRWYFAFGAAAILVLAVAVTVHMERSQPDAETVVMGDQGLQQAPPTAEPKKQVSPAERQYGFTPEPKPRAQEAPKEFARDAAPAPSTREDSPGGIAIPGPVPKAEPKPAPPQPSQSDSREQSPAADAGRQEGLFSNQVQSARSREASPVAKPAPAPQGRVDARVAASAVLLSPERLLERIAELRKEGRHNEADQLLAEFRERYPDYRISEEMLKKVERQK
jgi:hypothetical protein